MMPSITAKLFQQQTDRELLELAARAAGWSRWDWLAGDGALNVYDASGRHDTFNPLTDDGDAFRLAVRLRMGVCIFFDKTIAETDDWEIREPHGTDPYAATRRAIVRASAKIGEGK